MNFYTEATSLTICGYLSAIFNKVRAAPEGDLTPCSQAAKVLTETPSILANFSWVNPVLFRVSTTGTTRVFLLTRPSFICLTDKRRSLQNSFISASSEKVSNFFSLINRLLQSLIYVGRKIIKLVLRVNHQQVNLAVFKHVVINNSGSAASPVSFGLPSDLSKAACSGNNIPAQRISCDPNNKLFPFCFRPNFFCFLTKDSSLANSVKHANSYFVGEVYTVWKELVNYCRNSRDGMEEIIREAMHQSGNIPPTLTKNQGERVGIFVARDVDFSSAYQLRLVTR